MRQKDFFQKVYELVKRIPRGKVTSYGAIAYALGAGKSARMVGWALNNCSEDVPAHRVVNKVGLLTGKFHFDGIDTMQIKLQEEGVEVENNQIQNLEAVFWEPH